MRTWKIGALIATLALLAGSVAWARTSQLVRPRHPNYYRYSAKRAVGLSWGDKAKITQIGVTNRGETIMMVKSPKLKIPAIVRGGQDYQGYRKVTKLSGPQIRELGLVDPAGALRRVQSSSRSSIFKNVRGTIEFAGASNKGQSYKFTIKPKKPVKARGPYGEYTIDKLNRFVNVNGTGETAQPAGNSTWKYLPRDQR